MTEPIPLLLNKRVLQSDESSEQFLEEGKKLRALTLALNALSQRMLTLLALLLSASLFAWALWKGGWDAVATALMFSVAAWCIVKLSPPRGD